MKIRQRRTAMLLLSALLVVITAACSLGSGRGTPVDTVIEISTVEELQAIEDDLRATYILVNDIDAQATADWNDEAGFKPISHFEGVLDGRGYVIHGLFIHRPDESNIGLFAENEGTIRHVGLEDAQVAGKARVGILIGANSGVVIDAYTTGRVENDGAITGEQGAGGLAGENARDGVIQDSFSAANVSGTLRWVGGLVGINRGGATIERSYSTGDIESGSGGFAGGLVGANLGLVSDSYATGDVTSEGERVGGLIGTNQESSGIVKRSYSTGSVSSTDTKDIGGLIGEQKDVSTVESSYWNVDTSNQPSSDAGTGITSEDMASQAFWEGTDWDIAFTSEESGIWHLYSGQDAPLLQPYTDN